MSAKKVRLQLEEKLICDLTIRKKEIDDLVMEFISKNEQDVKSESEDEVAVEDVKPEIKLKKTAPKRKTKDSSESEVELERSTRNTRAKPKKVRRKNKTKADDDAPAKTKVNKNIYFKHS